MIRHTFRSAGARGNSGLIAFYKHGAPLERKTGEPKLSTLKIQKITFASLPLCVFGVKVLWFSTRIFLDDKNQFMII